MDINFKKSKYKIVINSDSSNAEILYELDRPTESGSSKMAMVPELFFMLKLLINY